MGFEGIETHFLAVSGNIAMGPTEWLRDNVINNVSLSNSGAVIRKAVAAVEDFEASPHKIAAQPSGEMTE